MSEQAEEPAINFKSEQGRILQTDAFKQVLHTFPKRMIIMVSSLFDIITVSVGTEGIKFPVYEAVIRKSSKFFDNAMKPEWALFRSDVRTIDLAEEDPAIFKVYLHWLYFKTFPTVSTQVPSPNDLEIIILSRSYVMGEMLMDVGYKSAVLNTIRDAMLNQPFYKISPPFSDAIKIIYDGTDEHSPARCFMVDVWMRGSNETWVAYTVGIPPEFTLDLLKAMMGCKRTPPVEPKSWRMSMDWFKET
jgi:hypothetical protein